MKLNWVIVLIWMYHGTRKWQDFTGNLSNMFHPFKSPQAGLIVVVVEVTSCKTSRVRHCLVLVCYSETISHYLTRFVLIVVPCRILPTNTAKASWNTTKVQMFSIFWKQDSKSMFLKVHFSFSQLKARTRKRGCCTFDIFLAWPRTIKRLQKCYLVPCSSAC